MPLKPVLFLKMSKIFMSLRQSLGDITLVLQVEKKVVESYNSCTSNAVLRSGQPAPLSLPRSVHILFDSNRVSYQKNSLIGILSDLVNKVYYIPKFSNLSNFSFFVNHVEKIDEIFARACVHTMHRQSKS